MTSLHEIVLSNVAPAHDAVVTRTRIPLGDRPLAETDLDVHGHLPRCVEVQHRRFHPDRARQSAFELASLDEARQIALAALRQPLDGAAVLAGDGREGAPLVNGQR